jgi:hypothetical protein
MRQQDSFKTFFMPAFGSGHITTFCVTTRKTRLIMEICYTISSEIAFLNPTDDDLVRQAIEEDNACPNTSALRWTNSTTNPANLPKSLEADGAIQWRIDGSHYGSWTTFYALPITLLQHGPIPLKNINVKIRNPSSYSPAIRRILDMPAAEAAMGHEVNRFAVSKFVRRVLSRWAGSIDDFNRYYRRLPYGSTIRLHMTDGGEDIDKTVVEVRTRYSWNSEYFYPPERPMQQPPDLGPESPPTIRLQQLVTVKQLHDTVSLIKIPETTGDKLWVFKTNDAYFLNLEIENLLGLAKQHDGNSGLMGVPAYLVTNDDDPQLKRCEPLGIILEYCPKGSLAAVIDQRRVAGTLDLKTKFRWAQQLARAVMDITYNKMGYHSSIKPNNILVNDDDSLRLIDMEQRGNWDAFTAPEISYRNLIDWHWGWTTMSWHERTMAEVYSVGKVLWCIFEGWSHTKNGSGECWFVPIDPGCEFPNLRQTPREVATLILDCVRGSEDLEDDRRWDDDIVVLDGVAYPQGRTGRNGEPKATALETVTFAKEMWNRKYEVMERYLAAKARWDKDKWKPGAENARDMHLVGIPLRPDLLEVCERLRKLEGKYIRD